MPLPLPLFGDIWQRHLLQKYSDIKIILQLQPIFMFFFNVTKGFDDRTMTIDLFHIEIDV